jgi:hypothetical protein
MSITMPIFILGGVFNMQFFTSCDNFSEEPLSFQLHSPSHYPRKSLSYHKDLIGLEIDQDYYYTPFFSFPKILCATRCPHYRYCYLDKCFR